MALFGTYATVRTQAPRTPGFAAAFDYVDELLRPESAPARRLRELAPGKSHKIELGGGVFVIEQVYETKPRSEGFFESHRAHVDVQVIFEGEELMELADASRMTVKEGYNAERDFMVWADTADASRLHAFAGDTAIFFPTDVHMPSLQLRAAPRLVRKAVVKVPVA